MNIEAVNLSGVNATGANVDVQVVLGAAPCDEHAAEDGDGGGPNCPRDSMYLSGAMKNLVVDE
jgi:hypothetical protein